MSIVFSRIDDRLLHGQVVTTWLNVKQIEQVIIVNEDVANDTVRSKVLHMAAPPTIKLHIFSPEKFIRVIKKNKMTRRTMLIFSNPNDVETVINGGIEINELNVGGMSGNKEREQITEAVSLTQDERECFRRLVNTGMEIYIQMVPSQNRIEMKDVL
ncbi:PTS sugar transporter subunit IIB [Aerococcus sp. UMB1112A]|uniref:PTS system mannose/fructose/N-acetylgalactosamine-transporter subunit IIB n=1 Tax=Aerococcus sp. UMB1112A TaxID=3050609 RepID=UPI00254C74A9|nr:PTS sugar transporter subunit IIB [Aerococcus sp. UMB1112A]MDK8502435.1 PTS sugar transporter subunit IIB [Aerococcus sp. UMB1112A]